MNLIQKNALRMIALILFLLSARAALGGIYLYRGDAALKRKDYTRAFSFLEKGNAVTPENLWILQDLADGFYAQGIQDKNAGALEKAAGYYSKLGQALPGSSRVWVNLALVHYEAAKLRNAKLESSARNEIEKNFKEALKREPFSAWIDFHYGTFLLKEGETPEEKQRGFELVKKGVSRQPEFYHASALPIVWSAFQNAELLKELTPEETVSYARLVKFMESLELWSFREAVLKTFLELWHREFDEVYERGISAFHNRLYRESRDSFQKALWMSKEFWQTPKLLQAEIGLIAARAALAENTQDDLTQIQKILEYEEDLGPSLEWIRTYVSRYGPPYVKGLWAFRRGDYKDAISRLEDAETGRLKRKYLALSYWNEGDKKKAVEILRPVLREVNPNTDEALLLKSWTQEMPSGQEVNLSKLEEPHRSVYDWWGEGFSGGRLNKKGKLGVQLYLKPGKGKFILALQGFSGNGGENPVIQISLLNRDRQTYLYSRAVSPEAGQTLEVPFETAGGLRWLEVELLNGVPSGGPEVQLGDMQVEGFHA